MRVQHILCGSSRRTDHREWKSGNIQRNVTRIFPEIMPNIKFIKSNICKNIYMQNIKIRKPKIKKDNL